VPQFVVCSEKRGAFRDTGIVNENIGTATQTCPRIVKHFFDTRSIRDIANQSKCPDPRFISNLFCYAFDLFCCASSNNHVGALASKGQSNGATNSATSTGD